MLKNKIVAQLIRFHKFRFVHIVQQTMLALFPIALVGGIAWIITNVILNKNGFIGAIISIKNTDTVWFARSVIGDIVQATTHVLALYAAIISAFYTAKSYKISTIIPSVTAMASYILIFFHMVRNNQNVIDSRYYSGYWFIFGCLVGFVSGFVFAKTSRAGKRKDDFSNYIRPIVIMLFGAFVLHIGYAVFRTYQVDQLIDENITGFFNQHSNYFFTILISIISTLLTWLGYAGSINYSSNIFSNEFWSNLTYALSHKNSWKIPYPFTPDSLFTAFAEFGGVGCTLALVIAIILIGKHEKTRRGALWTSFPVFFNINLPLLLGLPIIWNPLYFIPFMLTPIVNMVIGSLFIWFHIIPPVVYPIKMGTPGILVPLIGTGGNGMALLISLFLLVIDVLIYLPFVKISDKIENQLEGEVDA